MKNYLNKSLCHSSKSWNLQNRFQIKFGMTKVILLIIIIFASILRLYGLNWDQNQHLHPDERFLTMVASDIKIPGSFSDYLNPQVSTMSPYNSKYDFFVYGTFPLNLTKIIGVISGNDGYSKIHFVGRILSAFFDIATILFLFKIGKKIFNEKTGLLSAFLYSIMVLPIQLSHFFAVDTFLNFFLVLSFYFLISFLSHKLFTIYCLLFTSIALGISYGFALSCKISALYFLPIIGLGFIYLLWKTRNIKLFPIYCLLFTFFTIVTFRLNQPQAFSTDNFLNWNPNPQFVANLKQLKSFDDPNSTFPPAIQWKSTTPLIFPLKNMVFWGMGLPLGGISIIAIIYTIAILLYCCVVKKRNLFSSQNTVTLLILFWIMGLFFYQGIQFVKTMRYFLPIYPFLAILSAKLLFDISSYIGKKYPKPILTSCFSLLTLLLIYPLSFINIYSHPITRVSASQWIYDNISKGATIVNEEWDDALPLSLPGKNSNIYKGKLVYMYDKDTTAKWQKINSLLKESDYIFLTSNRASGSTMKIPKDYPQTIKYYQSLFENTGNFKKVAEFVSYPCFPPGDFNLFCFNDDSAEEAFTVYDHPKVLIFKNSR